eukprot:CAMPEP_0179003614 /NCGR_PEP_ID=MMETSP0795-20121207/12801_1 /TAXON_ID=88552 /ORGANISM="Amoebophrya sp., Strain Ameob2" /LENGTH=498 /DNA_ID=CAMNT_0020697693 /DNA_START=18 /DNA_END=1514 /DNA_ORIENTATION=+
MEEVCSPGEGLRWWQIAADGQPGHHGWWRSNSETQLYPGAGSVEGKTFVRNARHYFGFVSLNILPGFFEIAQCTCCGFVDPFQKSSGIGYMSDAKKRELQKDATLLGHTLCSICGDLFHSAPAAASSSGSGQQEDAAAPRKWHNGRGAGDKTELETPAERARVLRRHHEHVMKYRRRDFEGTAYVVTLQKSAAATVNLRQKLATSCDNFAEVETNDRDVPKPRYKKSTDRITVEKIFGDSDRHKKLYHQEVNKMLKILGKHPNVAQLLRADPQTVTLVCEYGGESLNEFVLKEKLKAEQYADLRKQLQTIAEYLWKVLVLHLDWKMENLVLMQQAEEGNKDKMRLRVIDFGNSQFVPLPTAAEAFVPDQDVAYTFPFVCRKFMETKREIANKEGSAKFTAKLLEEQLPAETDVFQVSVLDAFLDEGGSKAADAVYAKSWPKRSLEEWDRFYQILTHAHASSTTTFAQRLEKFGGLMKKSRVLEKKGSRKASKVKLHLN